MEGGGGAWKTIDDIEPHGGGSVTVQLMYEKKNVSQITCPKSESVLPLTIGGPHSLEDSPKPNSTALAA